MDEQEPARSPSGVRRSPTGCIPQWVLDEALGRPVGPVPFRPPANAPTSASTSASASAARQDRLPDTARRRRRLRRAVPLLAGVAVAAAVLATAQVVQQAPEQLLALGAAHRPGGAAHYPPPGQEESDGPLGEAPAAAGREGQGFRYLQHQDGSDDPVTWSPCRPIHYVVRPDHAPPGGETVVAQAVAQVSAATGLSFVDDGATTEGPAEDRDAYQPERYGDRWAPVLIAWATTAEVPDFGVAILGEAGASSLATPSGDDAYVTGVLHLDAAGMAQILQTAGADAARAVVAHELGHLVGLAHVDDQRQLMFPRAGASTFGDGDLAGLAALGRGPCQPDA